MRERLLREEQLPTQLCLCRYGQKATISRSYIYTVHIHTGTMIILMHVYCVLYKQSTYVMHSTVICITIITVMLLLSSPFQSLRYKSGKDPKTR